MFKLLAILAESTSRRASGFLSDLGLDLFQRRLRVGFKFEQHLGTMLTVVPQRRIRFLYLHRNDESRSWIVQSKFTKNHEQKAHFTSIRFLRRKKKNRAGEDDECLSTLRCSS